jgi:DNA-binding MarR family transcriptional regulator
MLKKFENGKLLIKTVSEKDSRSYHLELTQLGIYETKKLIELSNEYILNIIRNLDSNEIKQIEESIEIMTTLLKKGVDE